MWKKLSLLVTLLFLTSGCTTSVRETYISCKAGSGEGADYHLEYNVYTDFGNPTLEERKIHTIFTEKEQAYVFAKKYTNLVTNSAGSINIKEIGDTYIVDIKSYERAEFNTLKEYQEQATSLNKQGEVCQIAK